MDANPAGIKKRLIHIALVETFSMSSGTICSIYSLLLEYDATDNVEICSVVTEWTASGGEVYLLLFGHGLWFGDCLDLSLITLNQCQAFRIKICDDTTKPNREMEFYTEDLFIPLERYGSGSKFTTRKPTLEELNKCTYILFFLL